MSTRAFSMRICIRANISIDEACGNVRFDGMRRLAAALATIFVATGARAADLPAPTPTAEGEPEPAPQKKSSFSLAFAGGALVPTGSMEAENQPGLDVWGRVGWSAPSGIGLVMHLEYAPLRRDPESQPRDEVIDAHLFAATAGPRVTIGRDV